MTCPYLKKGIWTQTHTEERPREDTEAIYRPHLEASDETILAPSSLTSSLQNGERINFCCFRHSVFGTLLWQPEHTNRTFHHFTSFRVISLPFPASSQKPGRLQTCRINYSGYVSIHPYWAIFIVRQTPWLFPGGRKGKKTVLERYGCLSCPRLVTSCPSPNTDTDTRPCWPATTECEESL